MYQRGSLDSVLKSSNMLLVSQLALPLLLLVVLRMHLVTRMGLAEVQEIQAHLLKICSLVIVTTSTFIRVFRVSVVTLCFLRASTQSLKDDALSASLEAPFFSLTIGLHALPNCPEVGMGAHRNSVRVPPRQWPAAGPDLLQRSVSDAGLPSMGRLIKDKCKMSPGVVRRDSAPVSTMFKITMVVPVQ